MIFIDKRWLNFLVIIVLSFLSFSWIFFIFKLPFDLWVVCWVIVCRFIGSLLIFKDYSLSWSKATQQTFLIKSLVYIAPFCFYMPFFYGEYRIAFMLSELFFYLFAINFLVYSYHYIRNKSRTVKTKEVIIYGAGEAGIKLKEEFKHTPYKIKYFVDDNPKLHRRSIDGIKILSAKQLKQLAKEKCHTLLVISIPSASKKRIQKLYRRFENGFEDIKILPPLEDILHDKQFFDQLKELSLEELLARHPKDLDQERIKTFIEHKTILITGAGGSIGSQIARQCQLFNAKKLILLDHSEVNLYHISEELSHTNSVSVLMSVTHKKTLEKVFQTHQPDIVIHAAAYKHVPLVEENPKQAILNNIIGTKNVIDLSVEYKVNKFILISTDKAVRPTNIMGATKRVCELYAQNILSAKENQSTEIVSVRFGNVLGSSGSVIPKFRKQLQEGGPLTVTDPEITRYFMLIGEACELVLQAASLGKGGEIFILDMGEPVKIADLAQKMIDLSGRENVKIAFTGLRPGEKLYEELLINETDKKTQYDSIMIASSTPYDIDQLNCDINELIESKDVVSALKTIVPEFHHQSHDQ